MPLRKKDTWQESLDKSTISGSKFSAASTVDPCPVVTILAHPDPTRVGERSFLYGLLSQRKESISRLEPLFAPPRVDEPRPLADYHLSRKPVTISRSSSGEFIFDRTSSSMTLSVEGRVVDQKLSLASSLDKGFVLLLAGKVVLYLHEIEEAAEDSNNVDPETSERNLGLVGDSSALAKVRQRILQVADLPLTVLIRGETGTGKELVARSIFRNSNRRHGPFVAVNMAAVPPTLASSELFGAEKGAFTGANQRHPGLFREAAGGTLFLDEIGEAPSEIQVLLLRALESGEIQSVGGRASEKVDVRVIAATDRHLEEAVRDGDFRSPLLHRLSTFEIALPPLRDRREDIGRLFYFFLGKYSRELLALERKYDVSKGSREPVAEEKNQDISSDLPRVPAHLVERLALFDWPGNVRQLANLVRQLVVEGRGALEINPTGKEIDSLLRQGMSLVSATGSDSRQPHSTATRRKKTATYRDPEDVDEKELLRVMESCEWKIPKAANILGISRPSLYNLIDRSTVLRRTKEITREELSQKLSQGYTLDEMVAEFKVSKRALKIRMRSLGLL